MQKYTSLFFDLFNTLISVADVPEQIGCFTADILGIDHEKWNRACFSSAHNITIATEHEQVIRTLARTIDPDISEKRIVSAAQHRQRRFDYALTHVRDDVLDVLEQLKKCQYTLCLVSNASTAEVSAWHESPLASIFDQAIFSCECGFKKPQASIYKYALAQCHAKPFEVMYIGDGGSDELIGAYNSGLVTTLTTQFSKLHQVEKVKQAQASSIMYEIEHLSKLSVDLLPSS